MNTLSNWGIGHPFSEQSDVVRVVIVWERKAPEKLKHHFRAHHHMTVTGGQVRVDNPIIEHRLN
jgi:hypothetical protein